MMSPATYRAKELADRLAVKWIEDGVRSLFGRTHRDTGEPPVRTWDELLEDPEVRQELDEFNRFLKSRGVSA